MENDKIFELMTKMYAEMKEGFNKIDERFNGIDKRIDGIDKRTDTLAEKLDKNTLMLEKQGKDIQLLAEGHKNLSEQMERKFEELNKTIDKNYSLHDRAIKEISKTSSKGEKAYDFIKDLSSKNFDS